MEICFWKLRGFQGTEVPKHLPILVHQVTTFRESHCCRERRNWNTSGLSRSQPLAHEAKGVTTSLLKIQRATIPRNSTRIWKEIKGSRNLEVKFSKAWWIQTLPPEPPRNPVNHRRIGGRSWSSAAAIFRAGFHRPIDRTNRAKFEKSRDESSGCCSLVDPRRPCCQGAGGLRKGGDGGGQASSKKS